MAQEAQQIGTGYQHEQVEIVNTTGAALVTGEVFFLQNADSRWIGYIAREAIASGATGSAVIAGGLTEWSINKSTDCSFATGDEIYWDTANNYAITRALAKAGDYYLGECMKVAASSDSFVHMRMEKPAGLTQPTSSTSSSLSVSSSSTSASSTSTSSGSTSSSSTSASSSSTQSSVSSTSISSNSVSVSSSLSISSNSDSSSSNSSASYA